MPTERAREVAWRLTAAGGRKREVDMGQRLIFVAKAETKIRHLNPLSLTVNQRCCEAPRGASPVRSSGRAARAM